MDDENPHLKRTCKVCKKPYIYSRKKGHLSDTCSSCFLKSRRAKRKLQLLELKGNRCQICGYDRCPAALEFHHLDPATKKFIMAHSIQKSWATTLKELEKCVLVCANCHAEIENGMIEVQADGDSNKCLPKTGL